MQILSSALPGFRDLRAPVIAGYLWLIFAWLVVNPDFTHRPTNAMGAAFYDLGHDVSRFGIVVAVSVAAYFVGAVSQVGSTFVSRVWAILVGRITKSVGFYRAWARAVGAPEPKMEPYLRSQQIEDVLGTEQAFEDTLRAVTEGANEGAGRAIRALWNDRERDYGRPLALIDRARLAQEEADAELSMPATLLVGEKPQLFAEVDRLRAEGELRIAVVPPLIALAALLAAEMSAWWVLAVPPILILLDLGSRRITDSKHMISTAVQQGAVKSPAVERFREWFEGLPKEAPPTVPPSGPRAGVGGEPT